MIRKRTFPMIATLLVLSLSAMRALADDATPTVSATGRATVPQRPEILRMTVTVSAQGSDIHDALAKLKSRRDEIATAMAGTGADKSAIKFADPVEGVAENLSLQQRIQRQMMATISRNQPPPSTQPSPVTVSSNLTIEWTLSSASPDDALATATDLQDKITAAMPSAKTKAAEAKTPEEQEIAEEMAAQQGNAVQAKPDEPQFVFVHHLSDEERTKLLTQAFEDAQRQCRLLAAASGKHLGEVTHLSTGAAAQNPMNEYMEAMLGNSDEQSSSNSDEATGSQLNDVNYNVSVEATFKLQ